MPKGSSEVPIGRDYTGIWPCGADGKRRFLTLRGSEYKTDFYCLGLKFGSFRESQLAFREGLGEHLLDLGFLAITRHGQLAHQQVTRPFEHLLLAKGEWLGLMQRDQVLQYVSHFEQRPGTHALGILFEAVLPVAVAVALGNREQVKHLLDLSIANNPAQPDAAGVIARYHHLEATGLDVQEVEPFDRRAHRPAADLFNDSNTMVGINDLIANVEI